MTLSVFSSFTPSPSSVGRDQSSFPLAGFGFGMLLGEYTFPTSVACATLLEFLASAKALKNGKEIQKGIRKLTPKPKVGKI